MSSKCATLQIFSKRFSKESEKQEQKCKLAPFYKNKSSSLKQAEIYGNIFYLQKVLRNPIISRKTALTSFATNTLFANSRILSIYVSQSFSTWLSQNIFWVPRTSAKGYVKLDMTIQFQENRAICEVLWAPLSLCKFSKPFNPQRFLTMLIYD
jgi:hypothetical protein